MATPKFSNVEGSNFYQEHKKRVANYFDESKTPAHGDIRLYFKAWQWVA